ncbi:MAG: c-type cytochrome [Opitutus sp.]|nr:c-type cytochrome [Opitutus sp.]
MTDDRFQDSQFLSAAVSNSGVHRARTRFHSPIPAKRPQHPTDNWRLESQRRRTRRRSFSSRPMPSKRRCSRESSVPIGRLAARRETWHPKQTGPRLKMKTSVRDHLSRFLLPTQILFCGVLALAGLSGSAQPGAIALNVAPGFTAEEIFAGGPKDGSWSAMTVDPRGRLVISPFGPEPMVRVTLGDDGAPPRVERLAVPVTSAMGLLFAFDSFYVNGNGPQGYGLYRLRDTKGADVFDEVKLLRKFEGRVTGEHGSHGLVLGPDQRIYLAQGNHVLPPMDAAPTSPYRHGAEDQLLPSANYGVSGGDKAKAPAGHVLRLDGDGREVEVFAAGFRNIYDLAFDARGELWAFDSDTEYSYGLPWYVPTRILHVVSGGDYGFREGTGKWPASYPDTLPAAVNIGLGSPTGVKFGTASRFPGKYRRALFALDWTFGRILAVHLEPRGASAVGEFEVFLQGRPLNVTDLEFGRDGAMYFITGGRKTRSGLYRVRATSEGEAEVARNRTDADRAVAERRELEAFHGRGNATAAEPIWTQLGSEDRFGRHAARVALESQPLEHWRVRALTEKNPRIAVTALLALARVGGQADRAAVIRRVAEGVRLLKNDAQRLDALRVAEVALSRHGLPYPDTADELRLVLDPVFPTKSAALNRELAQLLIALQAPQVVPRTLALVQTADTLEEQIHYIFHLRHVRAGWGDAERKKYFQWFTQPHPAEAHLPEVKRWFADVRLQYGDGASVPAYLQIIRREAAATLSEVEKAELGPLVGAPFHSGGSPVAVKARSFVQDWQTADLVPLFGQIAGPRSAERGREVYTAAACVACHRYGNEGGAIGPDLSAVAYKLGAREMAESLAEPSKVISDQFQMTIVELTNGETRTGRIVERGVDKFTLSVNPLGGDREEIPRTLIRATKPSPISQMPPGLLNAFSRDDIVELLAYLGYGRP